MHLVLQTGTLEYGFECLHENNVANALIVCIRKDLWWKYGIILRESLKQRVTCNPSKMNDIGFLIQQIETDNAVKYFHAIKGSSTEIRLQVSYKKIHAFDRLYLLTAQRTPSIIVTSDKDAVALSEQHWWNPYTEQRGPGADNKGSGQYHAHQSNALRCVLAQSSDGRIEMGDCPVYDISKYVVRDPATQKEYSYHYELMIDVVESQEPALSSISATKVCSIAQTADAYQWTRNPIPSSAYINFVDSLQARPSVAELSIPHANQQAPATVCTTVGVSESIATLAILKQKYREEVEQSLKTGNIEHICTLEQFLKSCP